jgi:phospholipid-translocating ATPase
LRTHDKSGSAFIRTDQLDGETDWKLRLALPVTQKAPEDSSILGLGGIVTAEAPQKDIHSFTGTIQHGEGETDPISVENVLWMNTVLASADAIGLVVYTGKDTRAVMNTSQARNKFGLIEEELNRAAKVLFGLSLLLSVLLVSLKGFFGPWHVYLVRFFILFSSIIPLSLRVNVDVARIVYTYAMMDPVTKTAGTSDTPGHNPPQEQETFGSADLPIDTLHPSDVLVRNSSIPEELGRIGYLLSDKTGTLTQNDMELKKLHLGTMSFNDSPDSMLELAHFLGVARNGTVGTSASTGMSIGMASGGGGVVVGSSSPTTMPIGTLFMKRGKRDMSSRVHDVVQALALCHNVTPVLERDCQCQEKEGSKSKEDIKKTGAADPNEKEDAYTKKEDVLFCGHSFRVAYQASSPDEIAIVKWTERVGWTLVQRDREHMTLYVRGGGGRRESLGVSMNAAGAPKRSESVSSAESTSGQQRTFKVLELFPFTSETKRMGIVVQDTESLEIFFYLKGADMVMQALVHRSDWLDEECDNMAREGLRTLVIARKRLTPAQWEACSASLIQAKRAMADRAEAIRQAISSHLECDLELLGLTGVEDRLQRDVKVTLETLRHAGIKVWMLTGDKVETATCIGISSKLIPRGAAIYQLQRLTDHKPDLLHHLTLLQSRQDQVLVIDGPSLQHYLSALPEAFMAVSMTLPAVICCRCTPTQKADVAILIKQRASTRVACIGDGGNDVSMIQAAHVGIGKLYPCDCIR